MTDPRRTRRGNSDPLAVVVLTAIVAAAVFGLFTVGEAFAFATV